MCLCVCLKVDVINPRRACAARVTVLGPSVSVCLSVCHKPLNTERYPANFNSLTTEFLLREPLRMRKIVIINNAVAESRYSVS